MEAKDILLDVKKAIAEDVGCGDITAALISQEAKSTARLITREKMCVCGKAWFDTVFHCIDERVSIDWHVEEGELVNATEPLCTISGYSRSILTSERTALNFMQLLSGVSTCVADYVAAVEGVDVILLDTRKTIPLWRSAQKYAVACAGGANHRMGLYDAFMIKENHIIACGSISKAVNKARSLDASKPLIVEVEDFDQLHESLEANVDRVLLDNFSLAQLEEAVSLVNKCVPLEASGNITLSNVRSVAQTGVDYISIGGFTKNVRAIDLSLQFD